MGSAEVTPASMWALQTLRHTAHCAILSSAGILIGWVADRGHYGCLACRAGLSVCVCVQHVDMHACVCTLHMLGLVMSKDDVGVSVSLLALASNVIQTHHSSAVVC